MAALNPKTGKPWTAPQLLFELAEANRVANLLATRFGYCSTWEACMKLIVRRTGLPFEGRDGAFTPERSVNAMGYELTIAERAEADRAVRGD